MGQKGNPIHIVQKRTPGRTEQRNALGHPPTRIRPGVWENERAYDDQIDARNYVKRANARKNRKFEYRVDPISVKMF